VDMLIIRGIPILLPWCGRRKNRGCRVYRTS
jgi:hypothetical protein